MILDIRYRAAILVIPINMTKVPKHILRELFVRNIVRLELSTPFQRINEHLLGVLNIELPSVHSASVISRDQLPLQDTHLALRNFIRMTLARASVVPFGSIVTFHNEIVSGLSALNDSSITLGSVAYVNRLAQTSLWRFESGRHTLNAFNAVHSASVKAFVRAF